MTCFWHGHMFWRCNLLMPWRTFWHLTHFWRHDKSFDVMTCVWHNHMFLTSWQTFWRYDARFEVMTSLSWVDNINMDISKCIQIYQNDDVVRLYVGWVSRVPKSIHTPIISLLFWNYGHHRDARFFCAKTLCRPHQGCLLTSTYCTCTILVFLLIRWDIVLQNTILCQFMYIYFILFYWICFKCIPNTQCIIGFALNNIHSN